MERTPVGCAGGSEAPDAVVLAIVAVMRLHARYGVAPSAASLRMMTGDLLSLAGKKSEVSRYGECFHDLQHRGILVRDAYDWDPLRWHDDEKIDTRGWPDDAVSMMFDESAERRVGV